MYVYVVLVCSDVMAIVYTDTEIHNITFSFNYTYMYNYQICTQMHKNTLHLITHAVQCFYLVSYIATYARTSLQ